MIWILANPWDHVLRSRPVIIAHQCMPAPWWWLRRNWNSRFMEMWHFRKVNTD